MCSLSVVEQEVSVICHVIHHTGVGHDLSEKAKTYYNPRKWWEGLPVSGEERRGPKAGPENWDPLFHYEQGHESRFGMSAEEASPEDLQGHFHDIKVSVRTAQKKICNIIVIIWAGKNQGSETLIPSEMCHPLLCLLFWPSFPLQITTPCTELFLVHSLSPVIPDSCDWRETKELMLFRKLVSIFLFICSMLTYFSMIVFFFSCHYLSVNDGR